MSERPCVEIINPDDRPQREPRRVSRSGPPPDPRCGRSALLRGVIRRNHQGNKDTKMAKKPECPACGNDSPKYLKECPQCGTMKCDQCDMGDDVECPACESEESDD